MIDRAIPNPRGILIGVTCGVLIGLACWPDVAARGSHPVVVELLLIFLWASFGGLVCGYVSRIGWLTILGAMVGWMIVGALLACATEFGQAVVYGILPGGFFGGLYGYILGTRRESAGSGS